MRVNKNLRTSLLSFCAIVLFSSFVLISYNSCVKSPGGIFGGDDGQGSPDEEQSQQSINVFSDQVTEFRVVSIFETGATPNTENIGISGRTAWDITEESYTSLFSAHPGRTVTVPKDISQMTEIADQGRANWSSRELIALGNQVSPGFQDGTVISLPIIFLNGKFNNEDTILGVHFTGTKFAFVFKDVVESVGGTQTDQIYVEQATVVHEIGHAIGFVNNGVPMVIAHEDVGHPHHTTNNECVMFFAVESSNTILNSLTDFILGAKLNLFGDEVLADGRNFHP